MRVLVCGGRTYGMERKGNGEFTAKAMGERVALREALTEVGPQNISLLIHGGAAGADELAGEWAADWSLPCLRHPARWDLYARQAGVKRNLDMLRFWKPSLVVAFPGGAGTGHMVRIAREAGVEVRCVAA